MIKSEGSKVKFSGGKATLQTELTCIMKAFLDDGVCDKAGLELALRLATMSDDELDRNCRQAKLEMLNFMDKLIDDLYQKSKKEDEAKGGTIRLV